MPNNKGKPGFNFGLWTSVNELKDAIQTKCGYKKEEQVLFYKKEELKDDKKTLHAYAIDNEHTLTLEIRKKKVEAKEGIGKEGVVSEEDLANKAQEENKLAKELKNQGGDQSVEAAKGQNNSEGKKEKSFIQDLDPSHQQNNLQQPSASGESDVLGPNKCKCTTNMNLLAIKPSAAVEEKKEEISKPEDKIPVLPQENENAEAIASKN